MPLGSVVLGPVERTIAPLEPLPAYDASHVRDAARSVGIALRVIGWSARLRPHVRARALASALARGHALLGTFTLTDEHGAQIPAARILVIEFPRDPVPIVVVNLRDQPASRAAVLEPTAPWEKNTAKPDANKNESERTTAEYFWRS